jgi:hypothetical protein
VATHSLTISFPKDPSLRSQRSEKDMFARCGLEVEFDFSLPKTKRTKTAIVEAKRRDLQERTKAESEFVVNNRHHHRLSPPGVTSPPRAEHCANRNVITSAVDQGLATTRLVTPAEYDLFKENKRVELER